MTSVEAALVTQSEAQDDVQDDVQGGVQDGVQDDAQDAAQDDVEQLSLAERGQRWDSQASAIHQEALERVPVFLSPGEG